jgi:hypothetical protein
MGTAALQTCAESQEMRKLTAKVSVNGEEIVCE